MAKRRTFTAAFKARVAKQALRGGRTGQQIGSAPAAFGPGEAAEAHGQRETEIRKQYEQVGQLVITMPPHRKSRPRPIRICWLPCTWT